MEEQNQESELLEEKQRFSESMLWQLQRNYYEQRSTKAWSSGAVPHYITSNPYIASSYSQIIFAYLRDLVSLNDVRQFDRKQPIYIIELGAGSGRFSFHFLKKFFDFFDQSVLKDIQVKYVMTDFVQGNIDVWNKHPQLKDWINSGRLDFSRFDAVNDKTFILQNSGQVLSDKTIKNPLIVIANYFFDVLPMDVFFIENYQLSEGLVSLTAPKDKSDKNDPELIRHVKLNYSYEALSDDNYYKNPEFNKILTYYKSSLSKTCINFPIGSLHCLQTLHQLSQNGLMVITADKGAHHETDLLFQKEPHIVLHGGSFSVMHNYHALGQYILNHDGVFLSTMYHHACIDICVLLSKKHPDNYPETRQAYRLLVEEKSPDDIYALRIGLTEEIKNYTIPQIISLLRYSGWDSYVLMNHFDSIYSKAKVLSRQLREELYIAIYKTWDNYFHIGETTDVCLYIGILLNELGHSSEAIRFFETSIQCKGKNAPAFYNMSLCYHDLGQSEKCFEMLDESLRIDPDFEYAKAMKIKLNALQVRKDYYKIVALS